MHDDDSVVVAAAVGARRPKFGPGPLMSTIAKKPPSGGRTETLRDAVKSFDYLARRAVYSSRISSTRILWSVERGYGRRPGQVAGPRLDCCRTRNIESRICFGAAQ